MNAIIAAIISLVLAILLALPNFFPEESKAQKEEKILQEIFDSSFDKDEFVVEIKVKRIDDGNHRCENHKRYQRQEPQGEGSGGDSLR